jgi:exodeoxyribonuclease VII large subunit
VARAIRASRLPVIVGVGHETDFTIADFAADRRAPTPTAAAELATPARAELAGRVADCVRCLAREMRRRLQYAAQALDGCTKRLVHPAERLRRSELALAQLRTRLALALGHRLHRSSARLERLQASLTGLDPYAVLARGYSITRTSAGAVLRDAAQARDGEDILTTLARGALQSKVKKRELL